MRSFKDIPVGTPAEEIKRASDAFGLDFNFMIAVAKIESGFNPNQRTGSYIGLFQLSLYEFGKFGFGQIRNPRDNAVAAAYKVITEGILFEWITHRTPDLSDLYLIHQQGWEGAAEHISQPARIAWKSMCATSEGREKGEKWCKRAIWGNILPALQEHLEIGGQRDIGGIRRHVARPGRRILHEICGDRRCGGKPIIPLSAGLATIALPLAAVAKQTVSGRPSPLMPHS